MKLLEIAFPVYKLDRVKPNDEEGVTFYLKRDKLLVIDDKSVDGNSLARRRLKMHMEGVSLYKLKYAIFYIADLVKLGVPNQYFIDSSGKVFNYTKTKRVPLVFREITNVIRGAAFCIIEAKGIQGRHKALYAPVAEQKYAGFLQITPKSHVLYGYYTEQLKDTVRKI
jgi:hypothetical protein